MVAMAGDECGDVADEGRAGCCVWMDPHSFKFRVLVLMCSCLITFGSYFQYDNPGALENMTKAVLPAVLLIERIVSTKKGRWPTQ